MKRRTLEHRSTRAFEQVVNPRNELGKSKLAESVIHRRLVLDLLENRLARQDTGEYALEEGIHELLVPLRVDSTDVPYERMNLWIIDEKLSYHTYLASDTVFSSMEPLGIKGIDRPDIVMLNVFDRTHAFTAGEGPFSSVVLIEFKRPMRTAYDQETDPIAQVYDYIRKIRAHEAQDRRGRPVPITASTRYFVYIDCDLEARFKKFAENANLTLTAVGQGYFGYNKELVGWIEVLGYDKLLGDAKRRNSPPMRP